jgi:hypothetical protein
MSRGKQNTLTSNNNMQQSQSKDLSNSRLSSKSRSK